MGKTIFGISLPSATSLYALFSGRVPSQKEFIANIEPNMRASEFPGDITALIRPTKKYDQNKAFDNVYNSLPIKLDRI